MWDNRLESVLRLSRGQIKRCKEQERCTHRNDQRSLCRRRLFWKCRLDAMLILCKIDAAGKDMSNGIKLKACVARIGLAATGGGVLVVLLRTTQREERADLRVEFAQMRKNVSPSLRYRSKTTSPDGRF